MKKFLALAACMLMTFVAVPGSHAMQIMWDVGAVPAPAFGDADTLTGVFDEFGIKAQTSTIQYDTDGSGDLTIGDKFMDSGNLRITDLLAAGIIDKEGLNQPGGFEVTADWSNVEGEVTGLSFDAGTGDTQIDVKYTSGTIDFYLDSGLDSVFANPAGTTPPAGAGGAGFANGTLIGTLSLLNGIGHTFVDFLGGELDNQGSVEFQLQFSYMLDDFWLNALGVDLLDVAPAVDWVFAYTDMNINTPTQLPFDDALFIAYSNEDGSGRINVVPEPSTVLLLGLGLAGLGFMGYRRKNN